MECSRRHDIHLVHRDLRSVLDLHPCALERCLDVLGGSLGSRQHLGGGWLRIEVLVVELGSVVAVRVRVVGNHCVLVTHHLADEGINWGKGILMQLHLPLLSDPLVILRLERPVVEGAWVACNVFLRIFFQVIGAEVGNMLVWDLLFWPWSHGLGHLVLR